MTTAQKVVKAKAAYASAIKAADRANERRRRAAEKLRGFGYVESFEHVLRKRARA